MLEGFSKPFQRNYPKRVLSSTSTALFVEAEGPNKAFAPHFVRLTDFASGCAETFRTVSRRGLLGNSQQLLLPGTGCFPARFSNPFDEQR